MRIQYVRFEVVAGGREYAFRVTGEDGGDRVFAVIINNTQFLPGRLKYQEGPDITYRKLQGMLAVEHSESPLGLRQLVTESDITDYAVAGPVKKRKWSDAQRLAARQRLRERMAGRD